MRTPDPELTDEENPELDDAWFARARPAAEALPAILGETLAAAMLGSEDPGRFQAEPPEALTGIRLDADVLAAFRAYGPDWQTRLNEALRDWLKAHPAAQA